LEYVSSAKIVCIALGNQPPECSARRLLALSCSSCVRLMIGTHTLARKLLAVHSTTVANRSNIPIVCLHPDRLLPGLAAIELGDRLNRDKREAEECRGVERGRWGWWWW